jgi:hypothetical protein
MAMLNNQMVIYQIKQFGYSLKSRLVSTLAFSAFFTQPTLGRKKCGVFLWGKWWV